MTNRFLTITATTALALALWVVPSVGTRGQGALGDRFVHPDRAIVAEPGDVQGADNLVDSAAGRAALRHGDAVATAAVVGL